MVVSESCDKTTAPRPGGFGWALAVLGPFPVALLLGVLVVAGLAGTAMVVPGVLG